MKNHEIIAEAILKKLQVTAIYQKKTRVFCPHAIGTKHTKDNVFGHTNCIVYQFGGETKKGPVRPGHGDGWACFLVNDLSALRCAEGKWHTGDAQTRPNACIDVVKVQVRL